MCNGCTRISATSGSEESCFVVAAKSKANRCVDSYGKEGGIDFTSKALGGPDIGDRDHQDADLVFVQHTHTVGELQVVREHR